MVLCRAELGEVDLGAVTLQLEGLGNPANAHSGGVAFCLEFTVNGYTTNAHLATTMASIPDN